MYYGRREGYRNFGLQQLPTLQVSEYNAKLAISVLILLKSLARSKFRNEKWSLTETSSDLLLTPPRNTFKKSGYQVKVYYDNDPDNSYIYPNWDEIYYQDLSDEWHKVPGKVDHNGLYYDDVTGERVYFQIFSPDAERYGKTGQWTVEYKNTTISSVVTSSSKLSNVGVSSQPSVVSRQSSRCSSPEEGPSRRFENTCQEGSSSPSTTSALGSGRRKRQREPESQQRGSDRTPRKRRRPDSSTISPEEVGTRHQSLPRAGLSRLRRLEEEARDPDVLLVKGPANNLKCWRYRCHNKFGHLFDRVSSAFRWINGDASSGFSSRVLVTFVSKEQRQRFIATVPFPKRSSYAFGSLDSL